MTLAAADRSRIDAIALSFLSRHGDVCCLTARHLVLARLSRHPDLASQLAAVPRLIKWGPTVWPHYWCQMPKPDMAGDCGVHAAVVSELLTTAGIVHSRGRAAIAASPSVVVHWRAMWTRTDASDQWIGGGVVHHEVIRIGDRWWDPTEARWFTGPGSHLGDGTVVAVRTEAGPWVDTRPLPR